MREEEVTVCPLAERQASSSRRVLPIDLIDGEGYPNRSRGVKADMPPERTGHPRLCDGAVVTSFEMG